MRHIDPHSDDPNSDDPNSDDHDETFRGTLRAFLSDNHPGRAPKQPTDRLAWQKSWLLTLFDAGYAGPSWPVEHGGMNLSLRHQIIYQEEYARARAPGALGTGVAIAGPTLIRYGTAEQKAIFLPPLLRADEVWAQGYSEPEAGSDLPSLRTSARLDGDHYVVNGQKVWTTSGDIADIIFTLVRTGSTDAREHGITYLLIDAHAAGVEIRPLRDLTGGSTFAEIFFTDVRVPLFNRIGEEDAGWPLVRTSLGHERAAGAMNQAASYRRVLDELIALAHAHGATTDALVRDKLAEFEVRVRVMRLNASRTISDIVARGEPGAAASISRLFLTAFEQDLHEFAVDMLGAVSLLSNDDPLAEQRSRWTLGFLRTRASTIGAGTAEIQRNTIAEQVLGLPRDPGMPKR